MKNSILKNGIKCAVLMAAGTVIGTLLLVLAFLIPVDEEKAWESLDIIVEEPSYPALPIVGDLTGMNTQSFYPGVLDNSSDEIMLFTALDMAHTEQDALYRSMSMYNGYMGKEYSYYWHGYVSILRPLLCIFSYDELRFLNALLQLILMFVLVIKVWQKRGKVYGAVMFTSYVLLMPIALMFSLQYTWVFYIAMLFSLLLITRDGWAAEKQRYIPVFFLIGMLTSYFDMLTYPLFTWGIPLLWWMMMRGPEGRGKKRVVEVVASGISWILGYGIFWGMKWCLGTLVLKQDIIQSAVDEIFLRSGIEEKLTMAERLEAAYINWKHYEYLIYALILLIWLVWGLAKGLRKGWTVNYNIFAYCLVGLSGVVWFFVLSNHTLDHHFFTHRIYGVSILAFLAAWAGAFGGDSSGRRVWMGWKTRSLAVLLIVLVSVGGAFLAREDIWATNGYASYHRLRLTAEDELDMEFRPTFANIKEFGICAERFKEAGRIEVSILDGDELVCRESFPLEGWGDEAYYIKPVGWKLKKGKEYLMQIRLLENDGTVDILMTDETDLPMNEYGISTMNGEAVEGQLVSGVVYRRFPLSRRMQLFLITTWMGIATCLALAIYAAYDIVREKARGKGPAAGNA